VIVAGAEFQWAYAKLNNSVIRGTITALGSLSANDHGGAYAHFYSCDSRGTLCHSLPQRFRKAATITTTIATKASTIATKADGAENCGQLAHTKKS